MIVDEKRKAIENFCNSRNGCDGCPLDNKETNYCYSGDDLEELNRNYELIFGNTKPEFLEKKLNISIIDPVNRPSHYTDGKIEVIDFIEDKKLGFCLGNVIKYVARAGKKDPEKEIEDLKKAKWYLERHIKGLEEG